MSLLDPPQELLSLLRESLPDSITASEDSKEGESVGSEDILAYVTFLAAGLCEVQDFTPSTWKEVLQPYLEGINADIDQSVNSFREKAETLTLGDDDVDSYGDDDDDGHDEICNIRFK